jgi:hypothetical protein
MPKIDNLPDDFGDPNDRRLIKKGDVVYVEHHYPLRRRTLAFTGERDPTKCAVPVGTYDRPGTVVFNDTYTWVIGVSFPNMPEGPSAEYHEFPYQQVKRASDLPNAPTD